MYLPTAYIIIVVVYLQLSKLKFLFKILKKKMELGYHLCRMYN